MTAFKSQDEIDVSYTLNLAIHMSDDIYDLSDINRFIEDVNFHLLKSNIVFKLWSCLQYNGETWFNVDQDLNQLDNLKDVDVTNFHLVVVDKLGDNKDFQRYTGYTLRLLQHKCNITLLTSLDTKVFMHELGHALGLTHSSDHNNYMFHTTPLYNFGHFTAEQIEDMHWNLLIEDRKISPKNIILHDNHVSKLIFKKI